MTKLRFPAPTDCDKEIGIVLVEIGLTFIVIAVLTLLLCALPITWK